MKKNRFKQLLEATMGDVKPLLIESEGSQNFVITNETTVQELEDYLYEKIQNRYNYGEDRTFNFIIEELVENILEASGKSEQEAGSVATKFVEDNMTNNQANIPNEYSDYGFDVEGENLYKGKTIFEFTAGGDGYGYGGTLSNLNELLNDLKKLSQ